MAASKSVHWAIALGHLVQDCLSPTTDFNRRLGANLTLGVRLHVDVIAHPFEMRTERADAKPPHQEVKGAVSRLELVTVAPSNETTCARIASISFESLGILCRWVIATRFDRPESSLTKTFTTPLVAHSPPARYAHRQPCSARYR